MDAVLEKNIESLSKIFDHITQMFKEISPTITIETIIDEYISLVMYAMKNYNHLIYTPLKMWQLLNPFKNERGWNNIFLIAELCFCVPCSNDSLERFFSQMKIVKTCWRNSLSESNLTSLVRIKVSGPNEKHFAKAVNTWYHDKDRRINQKPQKKYRKRKASKTPRKEFQLPYLLETSSESDEEEEEEDAIILENVFFWLARWKLWSNKLYHHLLCSCSLPLYKNHK